MKQSKKMIKLYNNYPSIFTIQLSIWKPTEKNILKTLTEKEKIFLLTIFSFNFFPNNPLFLYASSTSLLKTMWEKEKLLVMSNFSFSHSVF